MPTYRMHNGELVDVRDIPPAEDTKRADFPTPAFFSDIEPYESPIDGAVVSGRRQRRYDLEKHDCVDYRDLEGARRVSAKDSVRQKRETNAMRAAAGELPLPKKRAKRPEDVFQRGAPRLDPTTKSYIAS